MSEIESSSQRRPPRPCCDCLVCPRTRYFVTFMLFLGMANSYVMRTNMSVAIVAMVNHTAVRDNLNNVTTADCPERNYSEAKLQDGEFFWNTKEQGFILSSFFYGYVMTQIPFGILVKKYGALNFLGYGMLLNSIFAFLVPIAARKFGIIGLCIVRFIQGLGEGPIVPCSHALLAKWIPPNERSRMGAAVYAGAQFGTVFSMILSGILAEYGFDGGWPSIFYVFGLISLIWSLAFLIWVFEDPASHPKMDEHERNYILKSLWGGNEMMETKISPTPFRAIFLSIPFYAILIAHIGQNYGYETLMTELPTYFKEVSHFSLKENGFYSSLPFLTMWLFSVLLSICADWMITRRLLSITATRKTMNTIGQYAPALALITISYTGCHRILSLVILSLGVGFNGAIYSGFKINHLDLSPRFAGFLMAITNCTANLVGLLAPITAGHIIYKQPTIAQWRIVFFIAAGVYIVCATFFNIFSSGERQWWDHPINNDLRNEQSDKNVTK